MVASVAPLGFIGNTDNDWFRYLRARRPQPDEVNFWQPSGRTHFRAIPPGAPFFFRLKAPHNAIAGIGFFSRFQLAPAWLAWDSFGDLNGAPDLAAMVGHIRRYLSRESLASVSRPDGFVVGCIMVGQPAFFADDDWVREPEGWHANVVRGARIDLLHGEGQRIFAECLERMRTTWPEEVSQAAEAARRGKAVLIEPRLGQGSFRMGLVSAYDGACAVTHEHSLPVLEAAHVKPFSLGGPHNLTNGVLLRADIHRLYDKGYVTITAGYRFKVSDRLIDEFHNGREYLRFREATIAVPSAARERPDRELLDWHANEVYLG
jgi:putative restriction endonuclease